MKQILTILLILLIISTVSICAIKPDMHKTVLVFDSAYTIVPEKQTEVETVTIPIMEKTIEPAQTVKKVETPKIAEVKQVKKETKKVVSTQQTSKKEQKTAVQKTQQAPKTTAVKTETSKPKTETVKEVKTVQIPVVKEEVKQTPQVKVLTQKEEEIAWNIWRSNLQNKIMQDVRLPLIPNGIVFKFSFTVDKFGKVSNVQTWSMTPAYTPYAIQYIAPIIRSYQGKSILNFPQGTARTTTEVTGGWKISENERYSTPQDYNDVERVKR